MLRAALEAQAPPKQNATDTINTLSGRLVSATLLEDRRGAILGLRSFAKDYPASVASGALRPLISTLNKDVSDVDTGKVVLETLLALFEPNEDSPEASKEISLWLADNFTQRQDNITVLLDLLENNDFYSRLYALNLLAAISGSRPDRTQESILSAPLGIGRLVSMLDDTREAILSAALLLLNEITNGSMVLQKVVAFENAFDRVFRLIENDGSLAQGGIIVQDCLSLLANLLHLNSSNQSLFRETGFVGRLSKLLSEDSRVQQNGVADSFNLQQRREKNIWGLLAVLRMFLVEGNPGCKANQLAFEKHSLLQLVLNLAFSQDTDPPIRAEALKTCADIIKGNSQLQERFAHNQVPHFVLAADGEEQARTNGQDHVYVIDALLDMTLSVPSAAMFDVRYASSQCIQAYFFNHEPIRHHFLRRAIDGHTSGEDETSNILKILIRGSEGYSAADPYRLWFAAEITTRLLFEDPEAKDMTRGIIEGNADSGEDPVTCVQALTGNLIEALQDRADDRIPVGYLMILCTWLFEDAKGVNDLLSEGSAVQSLIQFASRNEAGKEVVQGLCAVLLGILYEFSTKDSPLPRRKLQLLLVSGLSREVYTSKIRRVREDRLIRDFEILPQNLSMAEPGTLPDVYFDQTFVDFLKDNFSRLLRAYDRDPGMEVARQDEGIDRDLVDTLRSQIKDRNDALQKAESDSLDLQGKLGQEQSDHRKTQERCNGELARIKNINEALQKGHDAEVERLEANHRDSIQNSNAQHARRVEDIETLARRTRSNAEVEEKHVKDQHQQQIRSLEASIKDLQKKSNESDRAADKLRQLNDALAKTIKGMDEKMEIVANEKSALEKNIEATNTGMRKLETQIKDLERQKRESSTEQTRLQVELNSKEEARVGAQTELDDLLIVLGDIEEKRARDKKKLKELGAETSDDDDNSDEEEQDDGEAGEEEGEENEEEDEEEEEEEDEEEDEGEEKDEGEAGKENAATKSDEDASNEDVEEEEKAEKRSNQTLPAMIERTRDKRPSHIRDESVD